MRAFLKKKKIFYFEQVKNSGGGSHMKKRSFIFKTAVTLNSFLLLLQLLAMDSFNLGIDIPVLALATPILCLINVLFFSYWFLRFKWPLLLFFIAFALSFESWKLLYQFKSEGISTLKGLNVMSYNVRSFNRFDWLDIKDVPESIADFIEKTNPDVVCFQEFSTIKAPEFKNYPYKIFKPYVVNGKIGSCIISKYHLINSKGIAFKASANGGMQSDLIWKRDTLRLYNLHFESLRINAKDTLFSSHYSHKIRSKFKRISQIQKDQVTLFNSLSYSSPFPEIICTDLNNNAFSESYKRLAKQRLDSFREQGQGFGATYQFPYFPLRIDYILTDTKIKILDFKTHKIKYSDHRPISALLNWP